MFRGVHFFIEQPFGSLLPKVPHMVFLMNFLSDFVSIHLVRLPGAKMQEADAGLVSNQSTMCKVPLLRPLCTKSYGLIWALLPQIDNDDGDSAVGLDIRSVSLFDLVHVGICASLERRQYCLCGIKAFRPWLGKLYRKLTKKERQRLKLSSCGVVKRKVNHRTGKKDVCCT